MGGLHGWNDAVLAKQRPVRGMQHLGMLYAPPKVIGPLQNFRIGTEHQTGRTVSNGVCGRLETILVHHPQLGLVRFDVLQQQPSMPWPVIVGGQKRGTARTQRPIHVKFERFRNEAVGAHPTSGHHGVEVVRRRVRHGHDANVQIS